MVRLVAIFIFYVIGCQLVFLLFYQFYIISNAFIDLENPIADNKVTSLSVIQLDFFHF